MEKIEKYEFNDYSYIKDYNSSDKRADIEYNKTKPENIFKFYSISELNVDALIKSYFYASHPIEFSKYFKSSIDYLCIFNNTHIIYINLIYDEYFKNIMMYDEYIYLLENYTTDNGCLIVDLKNKGIIYYL